MDLKRNKVLGILKTQKWISYILQVGSSLEEDKPKDIDLLVGISKKDSKLSFNTLKDILMSDLRVEILVSDDALRFTYEEMCYDIAIYTHRHVEDILDGCIHGQNIEGRLAYWATKAWLPESFCADLSKCKVYLDKKNKIKPLLLGVSTYPKPLSTAVMRLCKAEIIEKIAILSRTQNQIEIYLVKSDIIAALIRYAFARDGIFLRGYKKLDKKSKLLSLEGNQIIELASRITKENSSKLIQNILKKINNEKNEH